MSNFFETKKINNADQQGKDSRLRQETKVIENKGDEFLSDHERIIADYAENGGLVF